LISEHLPPSRVDTCCFKVVAVTIALDFKAVVLPVVVSDSLGYFIEPELLLSNIVSPSLEYHVGSTEHLSNSVEWKLWDKVEWSVDVEAKFFVESLGFSLYFIDIKNLPSLVGAIMSTMNLNLLSFFILSLEYIEASVGFLDVAEMFTWVHEDLEPSWVSAPDLHFLGLTWALDIPWLVVISSSNSKSLLMEIPSLGWSTIGCLDYHVPVVNQIKVSIVW
jgi:hypothetical protein